MPFASTRIDMVIHAALLAGGRSTRMGSDKRFLRVGGEFVIDRMIRLTQDWASLNGGRSYLCGSVEGYASIPDRVTGLGPLGGLYTVVSLVFEGSSASGEWLLLMPVDMPKLSVAVFDRLSERLKTEPIGNSSVEAYHFKGFELPCLLRVSPRLVAELDRILREPMASLRSLHRFLHAMGACEIDLDSSMIDLMENVNTPDDWTRVRSAL